MNPNSAVKLSAGLIAGWALLAPLAHKAHAVGAKTPFTTLEAEAGTLGGGATVRAFILGSPVPSVATLELEASGGALVELNATGQSVSWTNPVANANTIVIRNSIPDAPNGGGITATIGLYVDGVFRQAITVRSKQSWNYRNSTTTPDDPNGGGTPWHFYNEDRAFITGAPIAPGSTITLQKDDANTAAVYDMDCIDLENVPAPLTQPANSLSIIDYGADPNFVSDSTVAIQNCINDARTQAKSVWIPPGKYMVASLASTPLDLTGVTVNGAGMWYSMIYKNVPLPPPTLPWRSNILIGSGTTLQDVSIDSDAIYRAIGGVSGDDYGISASGAGGWLIDRVWVQHCDAQWLSGSNGTIQNSRVADSWADGINLNNGNSPNGDRAGLNLTAQNNFVRGGGDDGIATYSDAGATGTNTEMDGTNILNNTSVAPYWANGLRVAGGKNVLVQNNLVMDPAANNGMEVSVFGNTGHPLDSATISGNTILRGGGWNGADRHGMHVGSPGSTSLFADAYTNAAISNNFIQDSRRAGLKIGTTFETLTISSNVIDHPALPGISIASGVTGTGSFDSNTVCNLNAGQVAFQNGSDSTFTAILTNNSWQGWTVPPAATGLSAKPGNNHGN
jgi:Pectate lyase superfamily protein